MWVLIEHREGEIQEASLETLAEARRLASKLKREVSALVLGAGGEAAAFADTLAQLGAQKVLAVKHELLTSYSTEGYTAALAQLIHSRQPETFLLAATALGRDLAPRLAARLQTSLVSDCTVIDINAQGNLELTHPSCCGRVYVTTTSPGVKPQVASVRPGVLGVGKPLRGRKAAVEELAVELAPAQVRTRSLGIGVVDRTLLDITEADTVLAIGRGLGRRELVPQFDTLAGMLNASLAGSRAAVDERFLTFQRQIGQTGKLVSPKFIVCCGISGAQQFTMGMRDSKFIVAINNDRNAPIFKLADVSVLGDLQTLVPELIAQMQAAEAAK